MHQAEASTVTAVLTAVLTAVPSAVLTAVLIASLTLSAQLEASDHFITLYASQLSLQLEQSQAA